MVGLPEMVMPAPSKGVKTRPPVTVKPSRIANGPAKPAKPVTTVPNPSPWIVVAAGPAWLRTVIGLPRKSMFSK